MRMKAESVSVVTRPMRITLGTRPDRSVAGGEGRVESPYTQRGIR